MKIYKVFFCNYTNGMRREIGRGRTVKKANKAIIRFLNKKNYKSYYWRSWEENGCTRIDVGSWFEFFDIKEEVI